MRLSPRALAGAVGASIVALVALLAFEIANWDRVTPGVTALGVNLGGLSRAEAATRLAPAVQGVLDRPLDIHAADQTWRSTPRQLGMQLAPNDLADAAYAVGRRGNPFGRLADQLGTLVRGDALEPASNTDQVALSTSLTDMAHQVERPPSDARINIDPDGGMRTDNASPGLAVDVPASLKHVEQALGGGAQSVDLVTQSVPPTVSDDQLKTARTQLERLFGPDAQPLTLSFGSQTWQLERADLARIVSFDPTQQGSVKIDDAALHDWAAGLAHDIDQKVQDARFHFDGRSLQVLRASKQGRA
ncbi:MAG: peptidoglycan binding domain-containing protein, partial [Chloroflexi bacterium]|nr:peptidoglycan binding domain-containing protein [Chloroflexota bacterium]